MDEAEEFIAECHTELIQNRESIQDLELEQLVQQERYDKVCVRSRIKDILQAFLDRVASIYYAVSDKIYAKVCSIALPSMWPW